MKRNYFVKVSDIAVPLVTYLRSKNRLKDYDTIKRRLLRFCIDEASPDIELTEDSPLLDLSDTNITMLFIRKIKTRQGVEIVCELDYTHNSNPNNEVMRINGKSMEYSKNKGRSWKTISFKQRYEPGDTGK